MLAAVRILIQMVFIYLRPRGVPGVGGRVWSWRGHPRGRGAGGRRDYEWVLGLAGQEGQGPWLGRGAFILMFVLRDKF